MNVSGTSARVPISCQGSGTCGVKLTLSVTETVKGGTVIAVAAGAKKGKSKEKVVFVGSVSRTLSGGQSSIVTIALDGTGKVLLNEHHTLKVKLVVTSGESTIVAKTVTFVKPKKQKKH